MPLDLAWQEGGKEVTERVWITPGKFEHRIERAAEVSGLETRHLRRLLGKHKIKL